MKAPDILKSAAAIIEQRGSERDQPGGERSMARTIATFNALTGHALTERDGWAFMVALKLARAYASPTGVPDDYKDGAAYMALAGEWAYVAADEKELLDPGPADKAALHRHVAELCAPAAPVTTPVGENYYERHRLHVVRTTDGKACEISVRWGPHIFHVPPEFSYVACNYNGSIWAFQCEPVLAGGDWTAPGTARRIGSLPDIEDYRFWRHSLIELNDTPA